MGLSSITSTLISPLTKAYVNIDVAANIPANIMFRFLFGNSLLFSLSL